MKKITTYVDREDGELSIETDNETVVLTINNTEFVLASKEDWTQICIEINNLFNQME